MSHKELKTKAKSIGKVLELDQKALVKLEKEIKSLKKALGKYADVDKLREYIDKKYPTLKDKITEEDRVLTKNSDLYVKKTSEAEKLGTKIIMRNIYVERLKELLEKPEFVPLGEEETVTYNNEVFEIQQLSEFDLSDPVGNEIGITISDPTSMVKDQIEWLFNFSIFAERMEAMGFALLEDRFIDGKDVEFLSKEAFMKP